MRRRIPSISSLSLVLIAGCSVHVPELDRAAFACHSADDCADDYTCSFDDFGALGRCVSKTDPCAGNPCLDGKVCRGQPGGGYSCDECTIAGCGEGYVCARSNTPGRYVECVPSCTNPYNGCSHPDDYAAQCTVVAGYPYLDNTLGTVQVCATCKGCSPCNYATTQMTYWQEAAVCTGGDICDTRGNPVCSDSTTCIAGYCTNGSICNIDCPNAGELCWDDGHCQSDFCTSPAQCPGGYTCNLASQQCVAATGGTAAPWYELGGSAITGLPNSGGATDINIAVSSAGDPVVSFLASGDLRVVRWQASSWSDIGGNSSMGASFAESPRLAITPSGAPVVAWAVGGGPIFVRRYTGAWQSYVGSTIDSGAANGLAFPNQQSGLGPALALDGSGYPIVAWQQFVSGTRSDTTTWSGTQIFLRRWNGNDWVEIAQSATYGDTYGVCDAPASANRTTVAVNPNDGAVLVGWGDGANAVRSATAMVGAAAWFALPSFLAPSTGINGLVAQFAPDWYSPTTMKMPVFAYSYYASGDYIDVMYLGAGMNVWNYARSITGAQQPTLGRDLSGNMLLGWVGSNNVYMDQSQPVYGGGMSFSDLDGSSVGSGVSLFTDGSSSYTLSPAFAPAVAAGGSAPSPRRVCVAFDSNGAVRVQCHDLP